MGTRIEKHIYNRILSELEKIHSPLHSAVYKNMYMNEDFNKNQIPISWPKCLLKSRKERKKLTRSVVKYI